MCKEIGNKLIIRHVIYKLVFENNFIEKNIGKFLDSLIQFISNNIVFLLRGLNFIFSFTLLELGSVANAFFLFKIPRIREILGKPLRNFIT
jgi:hypothetical protein